MVIKNKKKLKTNNKVFFQNKRLITFRAILINGLIIKKNKLTSLSIWDSFKKYKEINNKNLTFLNKTLVWKIKNPKNKSSRKVHPKMTIKYSVMLALQLS